MHRIKKYANRKLYDTTDKKYISRTRLSELIKQGEDIIIIDNETGEDLTASIVSNLIATTRGKAGGTVSSSVLIQLFRKGGNALTDYAKRYVSFWQRSFTMAEDEIDDMVKKLINNIFIDGQLEECDLTLKDLHLIARSFNRVLGGIFHNRIDYPEPVHIVKEKKTEVEPARENSDRESPAESEDPEASTAKDSLNDLKRLGIS